MKCYAPFNPSTLLNIRITSKLQIVHADAILFCHCRGKKTLSYSSLEKFKTSYSVFDLSY